MSVSSPSIMPSSQRGTVHATVHSSRSLSFMSSHCSPSSTMPLPQTGISPAELLDDDSSATAVLLLSASPLELASLVLVVASPVLASVVDAVTVVVGAVLENTSLPPSSESG